MVIIIVFNFFEVERVPHPLDVFEQLKSKSLEWDEIGRGLGVSYNDREELKRQGNTTTNNQKLEKVIHKWAESCCSEVSWNTIIMVLKDLGYVMLMESVKKYLLTDQYAVDKYQWKENDGSEYSIYNHWQIGISMFFFLFYYLGTSPSRSSEDSLEFHDAVEEQGICLK